MAPSAGSGPYCSYLHPYVLASKTFFLAFVTALYEQDLSLSCVTLPHLSRIQKR